MLKRLYRISEKNKHLGVTIDSVGIINPVNYPGYPPELELPEDNNNNNEESPSCDVPMASSLPAGCKSYNQINYFRQIIRAYQGRDEDAVKYVKKVKELIDKPLDELELEQVRIAMDKVKCPSKIRYFSFSPIDWKVTSRRSK